MPAEFIHTTRVDRLKWPQDDKELQLGNWGHMAGAASTISNLNGITSLRIEAWSNVVNPFCQLPTKHNNKEISAPISLKVVLIQDHRYIILHF